MSCERARPLLRLAWPFTFPFSPLIVAVNVTDCPYEDGFALDVTDVLEVAVLMVKLSVCELLEAV
jgi:hypothetical protein